MTGGELKRWMARNGHSVRSLADRLGVEPSTVQRWRAEERSIPNYLPLALESLELKRALDSD